MCDALLTPEHYRLTPAPIYLSWRMPRPYRRLSRRHPLYFTGGLRPGKSILAKKPTDSQDETAQGAYPSNPNATGADAKSGWYKPYTTGTFDDNYDQDGGLGQITSEINDGYPFPDGYPLHKGE